MAAPQETTSPGVAKVALAISGWNAVSRLTGFVRVLLVGAALGTTFLGNTYQSSNLVSNLLFELLAAGLLSAPLVGPFVSLLERDRREDAERLAGTLLGISLVGLGGIVVVLALAGHAVMGLLVAGVDDPAVRAAEVRLGAFFLWFFLPQALLYAVGAVASALLVAQRRFAAAAFAPVANNVTVIATMIAFMAMRHGQEPGLDLSLGPRLVLAIGTTAGVVAMTAVPVAALTRTGVRLRPRLDLHDPQLRLVARLGAWGAVLLASAQGLIAVTLVLANRVEGGVVAYQIAYTFFMLPVALVAHPVFTTLHPRLASHAQAQRWDAYGQEMATGVRTLVLLVLPAAALLAALAEPGLRLVRLGALDVEDARLVAGVLAAYALGLAGYATFQLLARAATSAGQAHLAALVGAGAMVVGAALMVAGSSLATGRGRVMVLGLAHSVAVTAAAITLLAVLRRRLCRQVSVAPSVARAVAAATCVWVVATAGAHFLGPSGRLGALVDVAVAGLLALGAGVAVLWALNTPEVRAWRRHLGPSLARSDA